MGMKLYGELIGEPQVRLCPLRGSPLCERFRQVVSYYYTSYSVGTGMDIPTLFTERLMLRGVTEADIEGIERHFVNYEVIRHLSAAIPWPYPKGGVRAFICDQVLPAQGRDRWVWGLHLKEAQGLIGAIDLWRQGRPENRGFWLGRSFWGRGYMTEAVISVTDFAFDELGFEHLVFTNAVGNRRSHDIKARTGATLIGVAAAKFVDPAYTQQEIWRVTKEEWRKWRQPTQKT